MLEVPFCAMVLAAKYPIEFDYLSGHPESHLPASEEDSCVDMWGTLISPSENDNDPSSPKTRKDVVHHTHDMYPKVFCDNNQGECKYGQVYFNGLNFLGSPLSVEITDKDTDDYGLEYESDNTGCHMKI